LRTHYRRLHASFGERIAARHPDSQTTEIQICHAHIDRFDALDTVQSYRRALESFDAAATTVEVWGRSVVYGTRGGVAPHALLPYQDSVAQIG